MGDQFRVGRFGQYFCNLFSVHLLQLMVIFKKSKMENQQVYHPARPIFNLLRIVFVLVPIKAGLDKFTNLLTNWEQCFNPSLAGMLPFSAGVARLSKVVGIDL